MPVNSVKELLEKHHVRYNSILHPQTYTAARTAQVTHIKGREMAKTVVVNIDGRMCMVVLPAHFHVNFRQLKDAAGARSLKLAQEREIAALFPECETGAMPPFGNLYGMEVYVEERLSEDEEIAFNAGTHTEVIKMSYRDFEDLVHPRVGHFAA